MKISLFYFSLNSVTSAEKNYFHYYDVCSQVHIEHTHTLAQVDQEDQHHT